MDMDLIGMTTMAKIGINFSTESGRADLVATPIGFPLLHFRLLTITSIDSASIG